ncbi:hypothetical protein ALP85_102325 [Pseudomonas syringae pv. syringae]|nr:hypothetical protein ALP85_102325 [Pseudomonas syringae pv. syringae]
MARTAPGNRTGHQRLALDLATHDAVEDHHQHRHADCNVLKGLFGDGTAVLQMRQAQHDRQNAEGDQNRVNQTLLVGHNGFLNAHEQATDAACLRAYLTPMRDRWHRRAPCPPLTRALSCRFYQRR